MKKILLIDDDEDFNDALKMSLELNDFQVISAYNGNQGWELQRQEKPDLVITDIVMPEMDGLGFLMKLRQAQPRPDFKVIVMSGGGRLLDASYLNHAKAFGADLILKKPFPFDELHKHIVQLIN